MKTHRRKDGRYEKLLTLHDGITGQPFHKHIYAATTDELNRKAARLQSEYLGLSISSFTVAGFIEYYLDARMENDPETSTLTNYTSIYNNHIKNTPFAHMKIETANIPACRQFLRNFRPIRGQGTRIKQMLYGFLHLVFRQAWKEHIIKENPFDFIDKPKHTPKERLILTRQQFNQILEHLDSPQMQRIMRFALNTGLRRSEICGLQIRDIHLKEGYISIRHGIKRVLKNYIIGQPKTKASIRNIAIPPSIIKLIKQQLKTLPSQNPADFLFQGADGNYITPDALTRAFARARDRGGLPKEMTLHSLRATVATYLAELDFNPKKIQAKLGHATPTMTMTRYIKQTPDMMDSMTEALNNF